MKKLIYLFIFLTTLPFLLLLKDLSLGFSLYRFALVAGSVAGFVGVVLIFWQFTLGMRFVISKFSYDTVWFNKTHQKIGKFGLVLLFVHPFLKAISYADNLWFVLIPDFSDPLWLQIGYGRLAFFLFLIVWVTSALLRKGMKYRPWLYIHYLVYPMMALVLLHARLIGTYLTSVPALALFWKILTWWFVIIVAYRFSKFLGIGNSKFQLVEKTKIEPDIFIYRFKPLGRKIIPRAGQYCHIQIKSFGEAHPFTVMESDFSTGVLTFGIKAEGKFTRFLSGLEVGTAVSLDGPYGVFTLDGHSSKPKVIIAGGIGVTPFVDLIRRFGNSQTYMFYANRFLNLAVRRDLFKKVLDGRYYDLLDKEEQKGENIIQGRLTPEILAKALPGKLLSEAEIFICGSKPFYNNYKNMLLGMNIPAGRIQYEEFGF